MFDPAEYVGSLFVESFQFFVASAGGKAGIFTPFERLVEPADCFFGAVILFAMAVSAHCFGARQHARATEPQRAVVMQTCPLREGPSDTAKGSFDLHPGTAVRLVDTSIRGWIQVELSDGRTGWIEAGKATIV